MRRRMLDESTLRARPEKGNGVVCPRGPSSSVTRDRADEVINLVESKHDMAKIGEVVVVLFEVVGSVIVVVSKKILKD